MSYDIDLMVDTGNAFISASNFNFTYNLHDMWALGCAGLSPKEVLHGKSSPMVRGKLRLLYMAMLEYPKEFQALNPPNEWGSYDELLALIYEMLDASYLHTKAIWEVN